MILETRTGKILRFVEQHPGAYGVEIAHACDISPGSLYPLLSRMVRQGLLTAQWGKTERGARRKHFYFHRRVSWKKLVA